MLSECSNFKISSSTEHFKDCPFAIQDPESDIKSISNQFYIIIVIDDISILKYSVEQIKGVGKQRHVPPNISQSRFMSSRKLEVIGD